ncbi:MAG TPA: DUF1836 domain-containing protein [Rectinemataceae bacterium]|nr:DUF1836 domain-containing protein [Rectinemataceae bacterium]
MDQINLEAIGQYFNALSQKAPAEWEHLPDIGLYMDQVVTYLERQLEIFMKTDDDSLITPSMINNYAKAKIVPRTEGKKYGQEHIALLLTVFTLKRVLSVQDMGALIGNIGGAEEIEEFYGRFRRGMEHSVGETAASVRRALCGATDTEAAIDGKTLRSLALELAVDASMRSHAAEMLLAFASPEKGVIDEKGAAKGKKEKTARKREKKDKKDSA